MQRKVEEAGKKWDDEWQHQKETGREFGQPNVAGRMNSAQNALQRKQDAYMNAKQEAEKAQYRADNIKHADYKIKGSGERARRLLLTPRLKKLVGLVMKQAIVQPQLKSFMETRSLVKILETKRLLVCSYL